MVNKRVKGEFERPIIIGSISNWLGKKGDGITHTHRWTCYIRGMNNEELPFIKKVVFHLHNSFKNPNRAVEVAPYEISEIGWGEFDIKVTLYFTDNGEKPVELLHLLRLHPPDGGLKTKHPVVSETLDMLTFKDPSESFYNLIKLPDKSPELLNPSLQIAGDTPMSNAEQMELNKIIDARSKVINDIQKYRDTCKQKEAEAITLYQSIQQLDKQKLILQKKLEKYNQLKNSNKLTTSTTPTTAVVTTPTTSITNNNNNNNTNINTPMSIDTPPTSTM